MRDRLHNEDRRPLRSRAMDQLRDLFDGMSNEPTIVIPLMVSFLIMAFCLHRLFVTNIPLGEFVQNSVLAGAAMGWVLGCLMIVICFCVQIEEQQGIDAKLNFGCGIITALIVFAWFEFITIVCMAPLAWFVRLF